MPGECIRFSRWSRHRYPPNLQNLFLLLVPSATVTAACENVSFAILLSVSALRRWDFTRPQCSYSAIAPQCFVRCHSLRRSFLFGSCLPSCEGFRSTYGISLEHRRCKHSFVYPLRGVPCRVQRVPTHSTQETSVLSSDLLTDSGLPLVCQRADNPTQKFIRD